MSRKKIAIAAAGILVVAGAVAAISAPGHRGGGHDGHMMGGHMLFGEGEEGHDMRGRFGRALTKDAFDARTRERFARIDKNSDNVLDTAEIEAAIGERMAERRGRKGHGRGDGAMGEGVTRRFDGNRDGKVTVDEVRAEFARRFAEADLNNDGRIDDADLPPMLRGRNVIAEGGLGYGGGGRHGRMGGFGWLRQADANKDGIVTREEVAAMAEREFSRFDSNKDGAVDQADREALRKQMVDYGVKRFGHRFGAGQDGRVTREQFQAKAAERFARMDVDGDGTIARGEMPGGGHGRRGWRHGGGEHDGMMGPGHGGPMGKGGDTMGPDGPRGPGRGGEPPAKN